MYTPAQATLPSGAWQGPGPLGISRLSFLSPGPQAGAAAGRADRAPGERRGLAARQAARPAHHLARGDGPAQGRARANGGPAGLGGGRTQGTPAPARPLRVLPGGRPAAHRWPDEPAAPPPPSASHTTP